MKPVDIVVMRGFDEPNHNGRIYPKGVVESAFGPGMVLALASESGKVLGTVGNWRVGDTCVVGALCLCEGSELKETELHRFNFFIDGVGKVAENADGRMVVESIERLDSIGFELKDVSFSVKDTGPEVFDALKEGSVEA